MVSAFYAVSHQGRLGQAVASDFLPAIPIVRGLRTPLAPLVCIQLLASDNSYAIGVFFIAVFSPKEVAQVLSGLSSSED